MESRSSSDRGGGAGDGGGRPFVCRFPVRFADVDHAGIVYYPLFYNYFHIAFEELFRARIGQRAYLALLDEERIGFPAVRSECDYVAPLRFGDMVEVEVRLDRLGEKSIVLGYHVYRAAEAAGTAETPAGRGAAAGSPGRELSARGKVTSAVVDLDRFRAVPIPERLRALFLELS